MFYPKYRYYFHTGKLEENTGQKTMYIVKVKSKILNINSTLNGCTYNRIMKSNVSIALLPNVPKWVLSEVDHVQPGSPV